VTEKFISYNISISKPSTWLHLSLVLNLERQQFQKAVLFFCFMQIITVTFSLHQSIFF